MKKIVRLQDFVGKLRELQMLAGDLGLRTEETRIKGMVTKIEEWLGASRRLALDSEEE